MKKRTYGKNQFDIYCQVCRCTVKAGDGELYRKGKWWTAYHDDCPGVMPHVRHQAGWVYIITGMGLIDHL